jgi:ADP-ribose pyrophosphatase YjhB (NUDIX family)
MAGRLVHCAVAVVVRNGDGLVLAARRPDEPGEELPGVWGLPAATLRADESLEDGVRRVGREKLGVGLTPLRALAAGEQQRPSAGMRKDYTLRMTVFEASMAGEPRLPAAQAGQPAVPAGAPPAPATSSTLYDALDWLPAESLRAAAARGSLCCRLFLDAVA